MKEREKDAVKGGRKTVFVLILLGLLSASFVASLSYRLFRLRGEKGLEHLSRIRVQVLNGCGVDRLAQQVTDILREKGFDVVDFANAKMDDLERTVVIDRQSPRKVNARIVARAIGCRNMTSEIDPLALQEVSLVLGRDYRKFFGRYLSKEEF